jgi:hypothetical protein
VVEIFKVQVKSQYPDAPDVVGFVPLQTEWLAGKNLFHYLTYLFFCEGLFPPRDIRSWSDKGNDEKESYGEQLVIR